ncbi:hypothetical protein [Brevibacterium paucivorans]|uniref:hypothetical protein n=1 Tax=Brevibacterium paucivorans TaxID=170994 RepID=UPI00321AF365
MLTRKNLNTIIGRLADAEPDVVAQVLSKKFGVVVMCMGDNWNSPILYVGSDGVQKNLLLPVIDADEGGPDQDLSEVIAHYLNEASEESQCHSDDEKRKEDRPSRTDIEVLVSLLEEKELPEVLSGLSALTMLNYVDFGDREGERFVLVRDGQVINRPLLLMVLSEDTPEADDSTGCAEEEVTSDLDTWLDVEEFVHRNPHLESEELKEALRYLKE